MKIEQDNKLSDKLVIDASVVIKLFLQEKDSSLAENLFIELGKNPDCQIYAPSLIFPECANVLWKVGKRDNIPDANLGLWLTDLYKLAFEIIEVEILTPMALTHACKTDISVYDACYVAAAKYFNALLITADEKLIHKVRPYGFDVISLQELNTDGKDSQ